MRLNFFDQRTLFWSPNCQFFSNCAHFWWAGSTLAISEDKIKKNWTERTTLDKFILFPKKIFALDEDLLFRSLNNVLVAKLSISVKLCSFLLGRVHFSRNWVWNIKNWTERTTLDRFYLFPKHYPRSMRLNFFDQRTLFWSPNCQFFSNCAHFWWAGSTLAISEDKIKKNWTERTTLDKFILFPKKIFALDEDLLFRSLNNVLVAKLSISVKLCSFLLGRVHFSRNWVWNIKNGLNEPLCTNFTYFQKKYPRSMRLNFFDHRTLFSLPNCQFLSNCAHLWWACSTLAIIGDKIKKKLDWTNHFGQVLPISKKSIRAR